MPATSTGVSKKSRAIARPLKVLVPLIQKELDSAEEAGFDYFVAAGELLIEIKESRQVAAHAWSGWLNKNFKLSRLQADRYMRLAYKVRDDEDIDKIKDFFMTAGGGGLGAAIGEEHSVGAHHVRSKWKPLLDAIGKFDADPLLQEQQAQTSEIQLHRDIAVQLIDLGYRAMAMRLHPDKGGTREAMQRLTTVRDELKPIAAKRRYI